MNPLVPTAPMVIGPAVRELMESVAAHSHGSYAEVSKLVGFDRDGNPDYPKVTLRVAQGGYGQPVGSVLIQQTSSNRSDFAGSLKDLDVRTAAEYYMRLNSADAVDAVEKVMRAPTPKAWALITLLDRMAVAKFNKEIEAK